MKSEDNASTATNDARPKTTLDPPAPSHGQKLLTPIKGLTKSSRKSRRSQRNEWEIMEGLRDGQKAEEKPEKYQGYLSKKKRWPMKGWHKVRIWLLYSQQGMAKVRIWLLYSQQGMAKDSMCFCTASREWQMILGAFVQPAGNGKGL